MLKYQIASKLYICIVYKALAMCRYLGTYVHIDKKKTRVRSTLYIMRCLLPSDILIT